MISLYFLMKGIYVPESPHQEGGCHDKCLVMGAFGGKPPSEVTTQCDFQPFCSSFFRDEFVNGSFQIRETPIPPPPRCGFLGRASWRVSRPGGGEVGNETTAEQHGPLCLSAMSLLPERRGSMAFRRRVVKFKTAPKNNTQQEKKRRPYTLTFPPLRQEGLDAG